MAWLWIAGPAVAALVFVLTDRRDKRHDAEVERWRGRMAPGGGVPKEPSGYRDAKEVVPPGVGPKSVTSMPGPFTRMPLAAGGGQRRAMFELVPKLAYLASLGGDVVA